AVRSDARTIPAAPSDLIVEANERHPDDAFAQQLRLKWTPSPDPVHHYNLYYRPTLGPDSEFQRVWLGATPNHYFFAQTVKRTGAESTGLIEVEAIGFEYGAAAAISTAEPTMTFPPFPN